jgi:hypothetical protein
MLVIDSKTAHDIRVAIGENYPMPVGYYVLVALYKLPEKVGSLFMPDETREEHKWQGQVGLVLAMGAEAYKDRQKFGSGAWCAVGDWVQFRAESLKAKFDYRDSKVTLAYLDDDKVLGIVGQPLDIK